MLKVFAFRDTLWELHINFQRSLILALFVAVALIIGMACKDEFVDFSELSYKGANLRDFVLNRAKFIAEYLVQNRENDTKSLSAVCKILHILIFQRGIDRVSLPCVISLLVSAE